VRPLPVMLEGPSFLLLSFADMGAAAAEEGLFLFGVPPSGGSGENELLPPKGGTPNHRHAWLKKQYQDAPHSGAAGDFD
jgi:hypothetical protein